MDSNGLTDDRVGKVGCHGLVRFCGQWFFAVGHGNLEIRVLQPIARPQPLGTRSERELPEEGGPELEQGRALRKGRAQLVIVYIGVIGAACYRREYQFGRRLPCSKFGSALCAG